MSTLRLGTRASRLALVQSRRAVELLRVVHPQLTVELVEIRTAGDRDQTAPLAGGQGWFTSAIQEALFAGEIDLAVHSFKDLPTRQPEGLVIAAVPERADPRDALVSARNLPLSALPSGTVVGTSSPRRAAQLRTARPDLEIRPIRGNVDTRLAKVRSGDYGATVLAYAGLSRLGLENAVAQVFEPSEMLPAPAQGALAIECRRDDELMRERLAAIDDSDLRGSVGAERSFLAALGTGCRFPAAAHAVARGDRLFLSALVASDGGMFRGAASAPRSGAGSLGRDVALRLMKQAGLPEE